MFRSLACTSRPLLLRTNFLRGSYSSRNCGIPARSATSPCLNSAAAASGSGGKLRLAVAANGAAAQHTMSAAAKAEEAHDDGHTPAWRSLGIPASELRLEWTLPTGQSFRWRQTGTDPLEFTGVVGQRAVRLRQLPDDVQYQVIARSPGSCVPSASTHEAPAAAAAEQDLDAAEQDAAVLRDYFQLDTSLADLAPGWCAACDRYAAVHLLLPGARMLRQDPVECLFQFICSSNNHISRIHGMVERLCTQYGTPLVPLAPTPTAANASSSPAAEGGDVAAAAEGGGEGKPAAELALHTFPTLEQLAAATEEELRADGFGYRAKYVTGSVAQLLGKPGGGASWLMGLRDVPFEEAADALITLPGIGPKVAACICLFSLDKHEAIPVDTHVWNLAIKYYAPHLKSKSLTKKIHGEVQAAFVTRFGPYAGWAHTLLFIAELASTQGKVPGLATAGNSSGGAGKRKRAAAAAGGAISDADDGTASGGSSFSGEIKKEGVGDRKSVV